MSTGDRIKAKPGLKSEVMSIGRTGVSSPVRVDKVQAVSERRTARNEALPVKNEVEKGMAKNERISAKVSAKGLVNKSFVMKPRNG